MKELTLDTVLAQNEALAVAAIGDEIVMLHVDRNAYYNTDAIGAEVWRQLAQPRRLGDVCDALTALYDVDGAICQQDVLAFLSEAVREDVVKIVDA